MYLNLHRIYSEAQLALSKAVHLGIIQLVPLQELWRNRDIPPLVVGFFRVDQGLCRIDPCWTISLARVQESHRSVRRIHLLRIRLLVESSSDGLVGLRNLGNTCFMNSILQCLSHTQPLTDQLLKGSHMKIISSSSSMKGKLIQAFADLIKSMWKPGNNDAVSPHSFKTQIQRFAPRFMGYNQQDAQEFLRFLVEGLHDDLNQVKSKPKYTLCEFDDSLSDQQNAEKTWEYYLSRDKSLMTDLFVGQLKSMLKCCNCGYTSVTFDPFWDLSLPIPRKFSSSSSSSSWSGRRSSGADDSDTNIRDCILSFTREEVLDGDERPTCDKCKVKRKSTKKFSIQRFPPILVLHLKRFSGFSFRSKLQSNVDFPLSKLDLAEFSADSQEGRSAVYSLYAVSNHSGSYVWRPLHSVL
ncbi:Ubiquitin carboxyl-terminal hydrolase 2 [Desmophyllum pertusum]|uniref:ubiquitinyl hydrolase 1 n=1 Tax=Desmophyllum pertusum TaxID=174260 RepID=A0A9X0CW59_9CNID|nr:Ubiquitin carboxyl-terminal hydrolase 2 [Desmophyllum pertusum]